VVRLASSGRYCFSSAEAREALGVSAAAAKLALNRLIREGTIASPARGFYVALPPEYRRLGCLPADQFIPELMARAGRKYYAALLSAAQYHGAAHHRPQSFQVMLSKPRRPIECGKVRVQFFVRANLARTPILSLNTSRGTIDVSTPEATALELVGYQHEIGGLDLVATLVAELSERIDSRKLAAVAGLAPVSWSQRLGYLLERAGAGEKTGPLKDYVETAARRAAPLLPSGSDADGPLDRGWKLRVNTEVEIES